MEHVEQHTGNQPTLKESPPKEAVRFNPNNDNEMQGRLRYQYTILNALAMYLKWREKTFDTNTFLTSILLDPKPDSLAARLHTLTQSTDEALIKEIEAFIAECKVLPDTTNIADTTKEDSVTVPEALRFLLPEGDVVEQPRTLH